MYVATLFQMYLDMDHSTKIELVKMGVGFVFLIRKN